MLLSVLAAAGQSPASQRARNLGYSARWTNAKTAVIDEAEREHHMPARRREPEADVEEHREAGQQQDRDRDRRVAQEAGEGGDPQRQALRRGKHLGGGRAQAEIGEEHATDPGEGGEQVQVEQDRSHRVRCPGARCSRHGCAGRDARLQSKIGRLSTIGKLPLTREQAGPLDFRQGVCHQAVAHSPFSSTVPKTTRGELRCALALKTLCRSR